MTWRVITLPEADKDLAGLDGSQRAIVTKAVHRVAVNPLPQTEGGYGKPLGNKGGRNLTGLLKIKLRGSGLRVVYGLRREAGEMVVVVVGVREDDEAYEVAASRLVRYKELL